MYGLINKAIEDMVSDRFGQETWKSIKSKAGVEDEAFLSMEQYPDSVTYDLVGAASEVLEISTEQVLEAFGEYWTLYTAEAGYGELLDSCGKTFPEFVSNLDQMHSRVKIAFPDLQPPTFHVSDLTSDSLVLHYYSDREGLLPLVVGLLKGLGARFSTEVEVTPLGPQGDPPHEVLRVNFGH